MTLPRLMIVLAVFASGCATPQQAARDAVEAPFYLRNNHIMLTVTSGGHDYVANYDSGAEVSVMSVDVARELNIPTRAGEAGQGFGGEVESDVANGVALNIGSGAFRFDGIAVIDFAPMLGPGVRLDFILGQTLFPEHVVEIDLDQHQLRWTPRADFVGPRAPALPMGFQGGSYTLPMRVNGVDGIAGIDLGSGTAIAVSANYARRLGLDVNAPATKMGAGVGGQYELRLTSVPVVSFAGVEMHDVPVAIHEGPLPSGADINVGTPVLFRYDLALDYAGRRAWLTPLQAPPPFVRDLAGMTTRRQAAYLEVTFVSGAGPAHDAGFVAGDRIVAIDGAPATELPAGQAVFAGVAGTSYRITLEGGQTRTLTLGRYY